LEVRNVWGYRDLHVIVGDGNEERNCGKASLAYCLGSLVLDLFPWFLPCFFGCCLVLALLSLVLILVFLVLVLGLLFLFLVIVLSWVIVVGSCSWVIVVGSCSWVNFPWFLF
jgi:hypothetical protein